MPLRRINYRVRSGDTLELLADRFDVTTYQIRKWNHLKSQGLVAGKTLVVYSGVGGGRSSSHASRRPKSSHKPPAKKKSLAGKNTEAGNHRGTSVKPAAPAVRAAQ